MWKRLSSFFRRVLEMAGSAPSLEDIPSTLPVLPLNNAVMFPWGVLPLAVGSPSPFALVRDALRSDGLLVLVAQKDPRDKNPKPGDLYPVATVVRIFQADAPQDGSVSIQVQGLARCRLTWFVQQTPYFKAKLEVLPEASVTPEHLPVAQELRELARRTLPRPGHSLPLEEVLLSVQDAGHLADLIAANLPLRIQDKQRLLETVDLSERLARVTTLVRHELEGTRVETSALPPEDLPLPAIPSVLPVLSLRTTVLLPGTTLSSSGTWPAALALLRDADAAGGLVVVAQQKCAMDQPPRPVDVYPIATVARILRLETSEDGTLAVRIRGLLPCRLTWFVKQTPYLAAKLEVLSPGPGASQDVPEEVDAARALARRFFQGAGYPPAALECLSHPESPEHLLDVLVASLPLPEEERQRLLERLGHSEREAWVRGFLETPPGAPSPGLRLVPRET